MYRPGHRGGPAEAAASIPDRGRTISASRNMAHGEERTRRKEKTVRQACRRADLPPSRRDVREVFPVTVEQLNSQLFFQQFQLFADARLGGVEAVGGGGDVQVVPRDRAQVAQLLQLHGRK